MKTSQVLAHVGSKVFTGNVALVSLAETSSEKFHNSFQFLEKIDFGFYIRLV